MSFDPKQYRFLTKANLPHELRQLPQERLQELATELRHYLLQSVSQSSGHLASGLGTVELTVALHYVFNTPFDRLIWDVGHQAYPHKILTGRRDKMSTIRKQGGLHPFPWPDESEYDTFAVGHSSTSISAALGMAIVAEQENQGRKTIAVIGDGALTAGLAFEALNHAGSLHKDMLVVLNDNEMSISENVGALTTHLARILSGKTYRSFRESGKQLFEKIPKLKKAAGKAEKYIKGMFVPSSIFEELGFKYIGPIDGHDVEGLVTALRNMQAMKGPKLLHVITKKGKGYEQAEQDPIKWHAVPQFDYKSETLPASNTGKATFSEVFGDWLCDMAAVDRELVAITPAMREGSGMVAFSQKYPTQYYDVAIAEQHAVTFAAGLAVAGKNPVVAIYSTFLQRAYDQLIHDVALQNLPVLFAIDRAGIVGADGATHQGMFDIAYLRCVPNMIIMTPSDENECRQMLYTGHICDKPCAVRYPRGTGVGAVTANDMQAIEIGKSKVIRKTRKRKNKVVILNFGTLLAYAEEAALKVNASVIDMRFVKPLDHSAIADFARTHDLLVTVEDGVVSGGAGSAVLESLQQQNILKPCLTLGVADKFVTHGTQQQVHAQLGLDAVGIANSIENFFKDK